MTEPARIGRRRFVRLAAVAGAAAAMNPVTAAPAPAAETRPGKTRGRERALEPALRTEIANQKKQLDSMLEVIRSYDLPAGSPPAMIFRPIVRRRRA
jgi:hypothetical protein